MEYEQKISTVTEVLLDASANADLSNRAVCELVAERILDAIRADPNYYPFGKLDPDDPLDQAFVNAFNKGAKRA